MALEGSFKDFGLQEIFQLIGLQRKTGILTIKSSQDTIYITFLDGKIVNADSEKANIESKLGGVLLKRGSITEEQLNRALEIQKQTLQRLGYVLVKEGFITNEELKNALTQQILQIVYKVFRWREGEFYFSQEIAVEYDRDSINPITSESVLMEGAQMLDEWPIIERVVKHPNMLFEKTKIDEQIEVSDSEEFDFESGTAEKRGDKIKLTQVVYDVYSLVDGFSTVMDIIEKSKYNEFDVCKALYELSQRNLIEEKKEKPMEVVREEVPREVIPAEKPLKFAFIPILILLVIFTFANLFRFKNPLNTFNSVITKDNLFNDIKYQKTFLQIYLLDSSIKAYFLSEGEYPKSLQDLFKYDLVTLESLTDPWNRGYLYINKNDNYYLIGFNFDGTQSLELIYTYILSGGIIEKEYKEPEKRKKKNIIFLE